MPTKKIACLGGGSLYFPRAISDLVIDRDLAGSEIVLYDIDTEKVKKMAAMGTRLSEQAGTGFTVRATVDLADAVDGSDFVLTSIGGSGAEVTPNVYSSYYHAADVYIPAKYGIHQVIGDTCGPAGMMMALRSIPAYLNICREMEKRCPAAIVLNHSNPMAVLCRAMHKYSSMNVYGVCHGVQEGIKHVAKVLGLAPQDLQCSWVGTNHYYWFTSILHDGKDVYPELKRRIAQPPAVEGTTLATELSGIYGYQIVYPLDDHVIEFYPFLAQISGGQKDLPYDLIKAAKEHGYDAALPMPSVNEATPQVRAEFFKGYDEILDKTELPAQQDNSVTGEGIAALLSAISTGRRHICILNMANKGAISNLPYDAEVELEAVTDFNGARAIQSFQAPPVLKAMLEKRFVWHDLIADAAVKGDRNLVLQALMLDEMAIVPEKTKEMLDKLLLASRDLLPQFF
jgi:alpha-galactosidase